MSRQVAASSCRNSVRPLSKLVLKLWLTWSRLWFVERGNREGKRSAGEGDDPTRNPRKQNTMNYLRSLGAVSREESRCRFCESVLPDWKQNLKPQGLPEHSELVGAVMPTMGVTYQGKV
jgi:hypothetical protein